MNIAPGERQILAYGDSLTYGQMPHRHGESGRFNESHRWTGVLQRELGKIAAVNVIEEGLRAGMLKGECPRAEGRDCFAQFGPILARHLPVHDLILMLGTNDAPVEVGKTPQSIAEDLASYFPEMRRWCDNQGWLEPNVIIVAPSIVDESWFKTGYYAGAEATTRALPQLYREVAAQNNAYFVDASKIVEPSNIDGVHWDEEGNEAFGKAMAAFISQNVPRQVLSFDEL